MPPTAMLVLLVVFGLVAGVGITAVGPGGVLVTVGLFLFTGMSPAMVAGTAIVTHIATGTLGTLAYVRSGQLREPHTRRIAVVLACLAAIGTPIGVFVNTIVATRTFGVLLGVLVAAIAVILWRRRRRTVTVEGPRHSMVLLVIIGFGVALLSGMFGVGGPLLAVPLLVAVGTPILPALAAAQVQSIVISSVGTLGYLSQATIDWRLALIVGVPELCGVLIGWRIAHALPTRLLERALIVILLAFAPFLAFHH